MVRCVYPEVLLSDYADGIADARARRIVERHVQLCEQCRQRVQRAHQIAQQMRRLPLLPPGVASRVARSRRRLEARVAPQPRLNLQQYPFYVAMLFATLLMLIALLTLLYLGV